MDETVQEPKDIDGTLLGEFNDDNKIIAKQTNRWLDILFPSYNIDNNNLDGYIEENSLDYMNGFTFFTIESCSIDKVDDEFAFIKKKMQKLFSAMHAFNTPICYGIISSTGIANFVIGIYEKEKVELAKNVLSGLLSGIEYHEMPDVAMCQGKNKYCGLIPAIPTEKIDDEYQTFDISPIVRSLNGENYSMLLIAKPVTNKLITENIGKLAEIKDSCFAVSKRNISRQQSKSSTNSHSDGGNNSSTDSTSESMTKTKSRNKGLNIILVNAGNSKSKSTTKSASHAESHGVNWSDSVAEAITKGGSISAEIQNSFALELIEYADAGIERLKSGNCSGMWQTTLTYSSDNPLSRDIIQASLTSEIAKPNQTILPALAFSVDDCHEQLLIPKSILKSEYANNPLCSCLSSNELGFMCTLPLDSTPNFQIKHSKRYPLAISNAKSHSDVELGKLTDSGRTLNNIPFAFGKKDLNKHTFVCGITGSGKTTTVKGIIANSGVPFMVIESAKKEYRNIKLPNNEMPKVFTLGKPEINCPQINPFYIMPGISPQLHIDFLKDLFNASFAFYGPMPYILEKCLQNIYSKRGWNLTLGFHPYLINKENMVDFFDSKYISDMYAINSHKLLFPTMYDLKCEIERYIEEEMQYEGEVAGNIKTAIKARLEGLCNGAKGYMFNTTENINVGELLKENTVFELEGLADDSDKAFCVGLLIILLNEYRQVEKEQNVVAEFELKHLLVIEEAHRLLKNVDTDKSTEDAGNPKGKAVEHFTNMLAEMRSYGQGVIVAEQIPSKLAPDVIKNSSNKVIQRLVSYDDQEIIGNTIGISKEEALYLGTLKTGYALCHKEGMDQPVFVKINPVEDVYVPDSKLYNNEISERMFSINYNIVNQLVSEYTDKLTFKLFNSILITESAVAKQAVESTKALFEKYINKSNVSLVFAENSLNKIISIIISKSFQKYMLSGLYSANQLLSNEFCNRLENLLEIPTCEKIQFFTQACTELFSRKAKSYAQIVVSEMIKKQYSKQMNVNKTIQNYFAAIDDENIKIIENMIYGGESSC